LYRADGPHALTDADAEVLDALDLVTVVDLRTTDEVDQRGCYTKALSNVVEYHLPMIDVVPDAEELPTWVDPLVVARRYRQMLLEGQEVVAEVLAILSDPSVYPAMFHCSAGKDRTGLVAALLLGLLGVPDVTIADDYALSAAPMQRLVAHYQASYPDARELLDRLAPAMVAAEPQVMTTVIDSLRDDYGSLDGYADAIGVGSAPDYIRAALLI
jgi:protein-tyrosine phosphatase